MSHYPDLHYTNKFYFMWWQATDKWTFFQLSNCCTDQLLAVIGTNCKSLEVLDAEEDSEMMTTDHGLSFLTNCVKLTTIILNDAGDEYDYEDRYFGITGKF